MSQYLIIAARFNEFITNSLLSGAQSSFADADISSKNVDIVWVPGCFEIPTVAAKAARSGKYSGIVCLGAVIRGETPHFDFVAGECARGLMNIAVETTTPIGFGILTTDNADQALARCGIKTTNKGREAAQTVLMTQKALLKIGKE